MQAKKVLFLSPTPTHPTNSGNRLHILSLVNFFKEQGCSVHFLYLIYENFDEAGMKIFFNENLYVLHRDVMFQNKKTFRYIVKNLTDRINRLKRRLQHNLKIISSEQHSFNSEVDDRYSVFIKDFIVAIQKKENFDVVVCEYVYISKYLTYFDNSVFKILDTHDRFTDVFKIDLNLKIKPRWWSLYKDQEKKALKRANLILATHQNDVDFFSKLVEKRIIIYNYVPEITILPKRVFEKKLLYIASDTEINMVAIQFFITSIFPLILKKHPTSRLLIGGSICKKLGIQPKEINLLGEVESLQFFYSLGDVAINPEVYGTGYKVKTMEAMSFGMPIVATPAGAAGVIEPFNNQFFIADTPEKFSEAVDRLFCNEELLKQTSINAHKWIESYKKRITDTLIKELPKSEFF
jgi:glycosyltransferase involved in cell wall biosynthesis